MRLAAEKKLKEGEVKVLVATASLELGIDIGTVDLVVQISSPRAIAVALQRVGRSGHWRGAVPKGRFFVTTRDELQECAALVRAIRHGDLDRLMIPDSPLDILAQQIVAICAAGHVAGTLLPAPNGGQNPAATEELLPAFSDTRTGVSEPHDPGSVSYTHLLVHADGITAIVTYHKSATCNLSSRDVHALSLLFNNGFAPRGGWRTEPFVTMVLFRAGVRSNQRKRSVRQRLIPTVEVCTS